MRPEQQVNVGGIYRFPNAHGESAIEQHLWGIISCVRDASPRRSDDADTGEIVDAVMPLIRDAIATAIEGCAGVIADDRWIGKEATAQDMRDVAARFRSGEHPVEVTR